MSHIVDTNSDAHRDSADTWSSRPIGGLGKRFLDVVIAGAACIILAPLMAVIAVAIKITMGGPVVFYQVRVGYGGCPFNCMKFRSMRQNADELLGTFLASHPPAAAE